MNSKDAKMLVQEYHNEEAEKELARTLDQIAQLARSGKTDYFTYFNYEKNVGKIKELGFDINVRSKTHDEAKEKYVTYYDINWREDV